MFKWVKGHQDKTKAYDQLPQEAQLNITADTLATEMQNEDNPPTARAAQAPMDLHQALLTYSLMDNESPHITKNTYK